MHDGGEGWGRVAHRRLTTPEMQTVIGGVVAFEQLADVGRMRCFVRRLVSTFLSLSACTGPTGERDATTPNGSESSVRRRRAPPVPQLQWDLQAQLLQQMMQWMQAVAEAITEGERDEQDHR